MSIEDCFVFAPRMPSIDHTGSTVSIPQRSFFSSLLDARDRLVVTQRSGLAGPPQTLAEIGECLGFSRERARQLETRGLERVRGSRWRIPARERLETLCPRTVTAIESLDDELFATNPDDIEAFAFFVNDVLGGALRVVRIDDRRVLSRLPSDDLNQRVRAARSAAGDLRYPLPRSAALEQVATTLECGVDEVEDLSVFLDDEWILADDMLTGFGGTKRGAVLAFVRGQGRPVSRSELERRFGHVNPPRELIVVDRGLLAVPEQIPDWARWQSRLAPVVREIIERNAPDRQWTAAELLPLVAEEADLPEWLNEWVLGSMLRDVPDVRYLGRNVIALPTAATDERQHIRELAVKLLEDEGAPMDEQALLDALKRVRGLAPTTWGMTRIRRPFVFFEDRRVGLAPRDLPGGEAGVAALCDDVFQALDARQAGLSAIELRAIIAKHGAWDIRAARSVLRHDGRFRCAAGGSVGLAEWTTTRAPSQREVLEELMIEHDGIVPIEVAMELLPTSSGEPLSRNRIGLLANSIRARMMGAFIEWMPPPTLREDADGIVSRVLSSIPEASVVQFGSYLDATEPAAQLRVRLHAWKAAMQTEAATNPHIELAQVERLAERAEQLLATHGTSRHDDVRALACAAVSYLAAVDDAQTDTALGGLDDDEAVLTAVSSAVRSA